MWDKQECSLYILLEYAEMDLKAAIKSHGGWMCGVNPMSAVRYFWNQMVRIVKVCMAPTQGLKTPCRAQYWAH